MMMMMNQLILSLSIYAICLDFGSRESAPVCCTVKQSGVNEGARGGEDTGRRYTRQVVDPYQRRHVCRFGFSCFRLVPP
jgi:hypothetical protein